MLFLEDSARAWLVVHGIVGAALVAAATHLAVWAWPLVRGRPARWRGLRILAVTALALYATTFALGNLLYPVYKVRVRLEFLEAPEVSRAEAELRARAQAKMEMEMKSQGGEVQPPVPRLGKIARLFDVKEHWAALGLVLAAGACVLAWVVGKKRTEGAPEPILGHALFAFSVGAAGCAWAGTVIGLVVTSYRSVGKF